MMEDFEYKLKREMERWEVDKAIKILKSFDLVEVHNLDEWSTVWHISLTGKGKTVKQMPGGFSGFCEQLMLQASANHAIKILEYLQQFAGDGKFYRVDALLVDVRSNEISNIINDLLRNDYVLLKQGTGIYPLPSEHSVISTAFDGLQNTVDNLSQFESTFWPHQLRITVKGAEYLLNRKGMKNKGHHIVGNSNSTFILDSPNSTVHINDPQAQRDLARAVESVIEALKKEQNINESIRQENLLLFGELLDQVQKGSIEKGTFRKLLSIGDQASSIGSFVFPLVSKLSSYFPLL